MSDLCLWLDQRKVIDLSYCRFKKLYKEKLRTFYNTAWQNKMQTSSKCSLYRNFKVELKLEKYMLVLPPQLKFSLIRFRTSNHRLPIETGRYNNTDRPDRICTLCHSHDIGDEYHYLITCP